jgi:hypothetical protein
MELSRGVTKSSRGVTISSYGVIHVRRKVFQ